MKAQIEICKHEPYTIIWKSKQNDIRDFIPVLENINFYNEQTREYVEIDILKSNFDYQMDQDDIYRNIYRISGLIKLEVNIMPIDLKYLKDINFSVDYCLDLEDKKENVAEPSEDYDFGSNYDIFLDTE